MPTVAPTGFGYSQLFFLLATWQIASDSQLSTASSGTSLSERPKAHPSLVVRVIIGDPANTSASCSRTNNSITLY